MEGAPTRRIIEVVNKCPTQALIWKYNKDLTDEEKIGQRTVNNQEETPKSLSRANKPTNIRIMKDGPIVVEGKFKIIGIENQELKPSIMTSFCRCGSSLNMPFCDGTHRKIDFSGQNGEDGE